MSINYCNVIISCWKHCNVSRNYIVGKNNSCLSSARYVGHVNASVSGKACVPWVSTSYGSNTFPDGNAVKARNYCRDPNDKKKQFIWCMIANTTSHGDTWLSTNGAKCIGMRATSTSVTTMQTSTDCSCHDNCC